MQNRWIFISLLLIGFWSSSSIAYGRVYFSPFVSVSSKKKIEPGKASGTQDSATAQRTTYGFKAGISFWRLLKAQLSVGRLQLKTQSKTSAAADDLGEINYEEDLNMSTEDPDALVNTTEITDKARFSLMFDPGFWILIARMKVGVQAEKRHLELTQNAITTEYDHPIQYKPLAGAGLGVKLGARQRAMAEYTFVFLDFPNDKPFEREVQISYSFSL